MRTDQTAMCAACGWRFSRALELCPTCRVPTADLRDPNAQARALSALTDRQRTELERDATDWSRSKMLGELPRGSNTAFLIFVSMVLTPFHFSFVLGIPLALLYFVLGGGVSHVAQWQQRRRLNAYARPRAIHVAPLALPAPRLELRGRVRVVRPIVSPVGAMPCAAFRVAGSDDCENVIDDAGLGEFEIVTPDGPTARLKVKAATIALEVTTPRRVRRPSPELRAFLAERGIAGDARLWLAEALLIDGDEVVISGDAEDVAESAGYRDSSWARVFTGAVVIRGASSALSSSASK